uniref:SKP1 component POZ domain-containing protein n=1 Tax=Strigamia maritima TaxID=126957 RepID=T1JEF0_STRMM
MAEADSQVAIVEKVYGNDDCKGRNSLCVKLIAKDGGEFIIPREHANVSDIMKAIMLNGSGRQCAENEMNEVKFRGLTSPMLADVCKYLAHRVKYPEVWRAQPRPKKREEKFPNFYFR